MAMNCKQFKHPKRVEKKQLFSFNPAEVNYIDSSVINDNANTVKPIVKDINLKKITSLIVITILVLVIFKSIF